MKCTLCGDKITAGDDVIGMIQGNAEDTEDGTTAIDVVSTKYMHVSCYKDSDGVIYLND